MHAVTDSPSANDLTDAQPATPLRIRYRIRFAKSGLLRWISHRDLARLWERLVRRAELKLSMTEGFHPKPRIAFPSALALGVEGCDEVVELELAESLTPQELLGRLREDRQPGLDVTSVKRLPDGFGKAQLEQSDYRISMVPEADVARVAGAIETLLSQPTASVERKGKTLTVEVPIQIRRLSVDAEEIRLSLAALDGASLKPGDVLDLLGLNDWVERGATITRTRVLLRREFESDDPSAIARADTTETEQPPSVTDSPEVTDAR